MEYLPFIIVGGILVLVGLVIYFSYIYEKKRTEALRQAAMMNGLTFTEKKKPEEFQATGLFKLFKTGHSRKVYNIISGRKNGISWNIFDYRYSSGGGKNSKTYNFTIAHAHIDAILPKFQLSKETFIHSIAEKFGYKDLDFATNPIFSKRYFLVADEEESARRLFTMDILHYFEQNEIKYTIEANQQDIIIYDKTKRIKPGELNRFIDYVTEIVKKFDKVGS